MEILIAVIMFYIVICMVDAAIGNFRRAKWSHLQS
jgi:hypothetical protein